MELKELCGLRGLKIIKYLQTYKRFTEYFKLLKGKLLHTPGLEKQASESNSKGLLAHVARHLTPGSPELGFIRFLHGGY